ncbi:MAG TPA: winged helix-turn-helix domain-containing protein [Acidimicrobiia bacterium]|nr:winged helix-turn-helix domain-containing protein [Acidimicrobiia bacterium]
MLLRFANCELDLQRIVLRRDGEEVKLEPRAFDVLAYLVQHRGSVVRKEELLDEIWGGRFVSESALTTRIKSIRQAVDDDGTRQAIIRTVHGKGYEFVATVETLADVSATAPPPTIPGLGTAIQPLIGRDALMALLVDALASHRLITLVGPGGVGKTSVGLELARATAAHYADGVHVIELVSVVDDEATSAAFATAIDVNVRRGSSIDDAITELLRPRQCLLLLDNCEHLIESVAALVSRILSEAPNVSIVATSREPLAVAGEQLWSVEPLSTAAAGNLTAEEAVAIPAVALFVERARAADPTFELDAATTPIVVEICRRLDGIPLAIELAAARTRVLGVSEIARRLDERFALLKAMRRGSDPRHRAMHDAISWSYDLLQPDEQELFTALSVFAGSFDLNSAEALVPDGDILDLLTRLTERSMLAVRAQPGATTRYELLETLRDYGRACLDDDRAVNLFTSHASHFASVAASVAAAQCGPGEAAAMRTADASFPDLRSAQRFAVEVGALDDAFGLIGSIREFAMRAMRYEVFAWAETAVRADGALDHPLAPLLTGMRAYGAWVRGEYDLALSLAEETQQLEKKLSVEPSGLAERVLGNVLYIVDRTEIGYAAGLRQLEIAEASGNESRLVHACYMMSVAYSSGGRYDEARQLVARTRAYAERTQSPTDLASAAVADGFTSHDDAEALDAFVTADRIARSAGNRWMSSFAYTEASGLLVARGEIEEGCAGLADMVDIWYRAGDWSQQWHTLSRCVIALHRLGNAELAMEIVGAIEAHATLGVAPMSSILKGAAFETRDDLVQKLGDARATERRRAGAESPVDDIVLRTRRALTGA